MTDDLEQALESLAPVTLDELDSRAALQRRVDNKYLLPWARFQELARELEPGHEALEIDGHRSFAYESVYFDTPLLVCFWAHVEDRRPRFKIRTRLYRDARLCSLEVKLKLREAETTKEQIDYDPDAHGRLTSEGRRFVARVLREAAGEPAPADLEPALVTSFRRGTVGATEGGERVTVDVGLRLARPGDGARCLHAGYALVETKTEAGEGRADELLRRAGVAPVSVSKYRLGIGLLAARDPDPPLGAERDRYIGSCGGPGGG